MTEELLVNISDMKYGNSGENIVTYALGSCIGMAFYDPLIKAGALLHYLLPESTLDRNKAKMNPFMFADTGMAKTIKTLEGLGVQKRRLIIKAAGGANYLDPNGKFKIVKRPNLGVKRILWKHNLMV